MSRRENIAALSERRIALVMEATRLNAEHLRLTTVAQGAEIDPHDETGRADAALGRTEAAIADVEAKLAALDEEIAEARRAEDEDKGGDAP